MAFSLPNYTDPATGAPVTYFVISQVELAPLNNSLNVLVNGYVNAQDYAAGKAPVNLSVNLIFNIDGATYAQFLAAQTVSDLPAGSSQSQLLTQLLGALSQNMLTLPFFSGAQIVA